MRKLIAALVAVAALPAFADTCPNPAEMFVKENGRYELKIPGFRVVHDERDKSSAPDYEFITAVWGNATGTSSTVRCEYGQDGGRIGHIHLQSIANYPEAAVKAHSGWVHGSNGSIYRCFGDGVKDCAFN